MSLKQKPLFPMPLVMGIILIFVIGAMMVFFIGDAVPWNCHRDYGGESYYVNQCLKMRSMGLILPTLGNIVGIGLIVYDKAQLSRVKNWHTAVLFSSYAVMFFTPTWDLLYTVDCPNQECSDLRLQIILLESTLVPTFGFIGYNFRRLVFKK